MKPVLLVASLLFAVPAFASEWEQRVDAFRTKTLAERAKLGLDKLPPEQLQERFPTPELRFEGNASANEVLTVVCPGEPKLIKAEGTLPTGVLITPTTDDIAISQEKLKPGHWSGMLTAKKTAPPQIFFLQSVIPLSGNTATLYRFIVGCRQTIVIETEGATLTLKADLRERSQIVPGEWKEGGKVLGTMNYELWPEGDYFVLRGQVSPEEMQRRSSVMVERMQSPQFVDLMARVQKQIDQMQKCSTLAPDKMTTCIQRLKPAMEALSQEQEVYSADTERKAAPLFGCDEFRIEFTGERNGTACAGHRREEAIPVKASWTGG